ncbi:MAG TPA: alpha/beta fold hydrolase [Herpetosiphonaceae bacterium]
MALEVITKRPLSEPKPHPIVFVHGAWHGAWCWDEFFLDYFVQHGYVVHALSFQSHGDSHAPKSLRRCHIADYLGDLTGVVRALPETPILVGHSMGGLVVQKYLERAPAEAGVLLASVPTIGAIGATLRTVLRIPDKFVKATLQWRLYPVIETPELAREAFFSESLPEDRLQRYFALLQDESYNAFLDMVLVPPRPHRVSTPMLVLGGGSDTIFGPAEIEATARSYSTQSHIFPGIAHDMMLEDGWQAVADHIIEWLSSRGL